MSEVLKNCPFCGGEAEECWDSIHKENAHYLWIECKNCEATCRSIKLWNTRPQTLEYRKPFLCKCRNDKDGAITVRKLEDGLCQCPRCGGLFITQTLEPLDSIKLVNRCKERLKECFPMREENEVAINYMLARLIKVFDEFGQPQDQSMKKQLCAVCNSDLNLLKKAYIDSKPQERVVSEDRLKQLIDHYSAYIESDGFRMFRNELAKVIIDSFRDGSLYK